MPTTTTGRWGVCPWDEAYYEETAVLDEKPYDFPFTEPVLYANRPLVFFDPYKNGLKAQALKGAGPKRFVGLELEYADVSVAGSRSCANLNRILRRWSTSVVHDGSLPEQGFEVTTSPARGQLFLDMCDDICTALSACEAITTRSCGFHVHVDCSDFAWPQVRALVHLYERVEEALFETVSTSRRSNEYCLRVGDRYTQLIKKSEEDTLRCYADTVQGDPTKGKRKALMTALYRTHHDLETKRRTEERRPQIRYYAMNLHSFFFRPKGTHTPRRTVEARHHQGTKAYEKITNWAMVWDQLCSYAYATPLAQVEAIPQYRPWDILALVLRPAQFEYLKARKAKLA